MFQYLGVCSHIWKQFSLTLLLFQPGGYNRPHACTCVCVLVFSEGKIHMEGNHSECTQRKLNKMSSVVWLQIRRTESTCSECHVWFKDWRTFGETGERALCSCGYIKQCFLLQNWAGSQVLIWEKSDVFSRASWHSKAVTDDCVFPLRAPYTMHNPPLYLCHSPICSGNFLLNHIWDVEG